MTLDIVFLFYTSFYQELDDVKREREKRRGEGEKKEEGVAARVKRRG